METPEEAQYMLQHTSVDGVWTGSSTERLPIERAVTEAATQFASLKLAEERPRDATQKTRRGPGTLDTKGDEVAFLSEQIRALGHQPVIFDVGVVGEPRDARFRSEHDCRGGGTPLETLLQNPTRGKQRP